MQFLTALVAIASLAGLAVATPSLTDIESQAESHVQGLLKAGCDIVSCAESVGTTVAACGASVLEDGFNPIADVSCLSAIGSSVVDPPAACKACL